MTNTSTRTSRKASTVRKPAQAPAPAAEESRADIYQRVNQRWVSTLISDVRTRHKISELNVKCTSLILLTNQSKRRAVIL